MHWILQNELFKNVELVQLVQTLTAFKLPYSFHKVIPFIGELIPPAYPRDPKVICLGSYSMRHAARINNWTPGVYDVGDIDFAIQHKHWGDNMLNADSVVYAFSDVKIDKPMFIRPAHDNKYVLAKVYEPEEFHDWQAKVCAMNYDFEYSLQNSTLMQVCCPKTIYAEYRYWIVDGKIATQSLYKRGDVVLYSNTVDPCFDYFIEDILKDTPSELLPKAFIIDVCDTPNGIKIVEINTMNAAGFYAADIQKLIMALEDAESNP